MQETVQTGEEGSGIALKKDDKILFSVYKRV